MKTVYCKTREAARTMAREEGVTWKDMGKDNAGGRWAVLFPEIKDLVENVKAVEMNVPTKEDKELTDALSAAFAAMDKADIIPVLNKPETIVRNSHSVLKDRKGNSVQIFTKRRVAV